MPLPITSLLKGADERRIRASLSRPTASANAGTVGKLLELFAPFAHRNAASDFAVQDTVSPAKVDRLVLLSVQ